MFEAVRRPLDNYKRSYFATKKCLTDIKYSGGISKNGIEVIAGNQGATKETVSLLQKLLNAK